MAEIINLNKVRKAQTKASQKKQAATNRFLHGLSKEAKQKALTEAQKERQALEQKKLEE